MHSVLKYIGQKDLNLVEDLRVFGIKTYCEPFAGSFNVGFKVADSNYKCKLVLNDLDEKIYNFWKQLRKHPEMLETRIRLLLDKMDGLKDSAYLGNNIEEMKELLDKKSNSVSKIESAAAEYVIQNTKTMKGFSYIRYRLERSLDRYDFQLNSEYLKEIKIYNEDYYKMFDKFDSPTTFFFIDPPYTSKHVNNYYRCDSAKFNHAKLCERIKKLKGRWLLTYDYSPKLLEMYEGYNIEIKERKLFGKIYREMYISNYKI